MPKFTIFKLIIFDILFRLTFVNNSAANFLVRNVGQDVVFMWNRTSGSIDEVRWGLFNQAAQDEISPKFIYVNKWANVAVYNSDLDTSAASKYKGRVHYVGNVPAGRAWFKITNLSTSDTNEYAVSILEGRVYASFKVALTVAATPKFQSLPPMTTTITEGQDLRVPCTAVGPPAPNVTWVRTAGHVTMSTGTGSATLSITTIGRDQNGSMFECHTWNNPNENPVTAQTLVIVYYPPQATTTPVSITVVQRKEIVLSCTADGNPPPSISWTKDDGVIKAGHTVAGGTLRIPDAIKTDAGKYICTAKNTYDSREHSSTATATVVVKYQPSILLGELNNQIRTFNESELLTIKCEADGHPTPTIKWKTPKGTVHTGKVLDIPLVKRSDAGDYMCIADNGIGSEVNASIQITIQYTPIIDEARSSGNTDSWNGKGIQLRCTATGIPGPQVSWYKPTHQQILGGSEVTVLTTADQEDYGQYTCRATNILGSDEHVINVTQLFSPGPVDITVTNIEASSVTVSWTKPDDNGGKPVLDYKVEINSSEASVKRVNTYAAIITKLKQNTRYQVTVSAENVVGYGNTSTKGFTTLKEGPPEVPELTATLDHTSGLCIWLTWTKPDDNGGEISKYTIYMKEDGDSEWKKVDDVSNQPSLQYNISTNIEYGKEYKVIVTAWNVHGESIKDDVLAKTIAIPDYKLSTTPSSNGGNPNNDKRTSDNGSDGAVIAGAVGAVLFMLLIALILGIIIIRKKGLLSKGLKRRSPSSRAAYDNDIDPDSVTQQAAAGFGGADDGIATYAAVDMSKKKKKKAQDNIPNYAVVDKSKKRPGEIIYAELAEFNTAGPTAASAAPRPITYTGTDYADIAQFQKQDDEPEPTYANFPGRGKNYTNIQGTLS